VSEFSRGRRLARGFSALLIMALCSVMIMAAGAQAQLQPAAAPAAPPPAVNAADHP
jgi:hypothetical protein